MRFHMPSRFSPSEILTELCKNKNTFLAHVSGFTRLRWRVWIYHLVHITKFALYHCGRFSHFLSWQILVVFFAKQHDARVYASSCFFVVFGTLKPEQDNWHFEEEKLKCIVSKLYRERYSHEQTPMFYHSQYFQQRYNDVKRRYLIELNFHLPCT